MKKLSESNPAFLLRIFKNSNILIASGIVLLALGGISLGDLIEPQLPKPKPSAIQEFPITESPKKEPQQMVEVKFQVISSSDRKPLSGVRVMFTPDGPPVEGLTDDYGYISIRIPKETEVKINFTKEGFLDKSITANLVIDAATLQIYALDPEVLQPPPPPVPPVESLNWPTRDISIEITDTKEDGSRWDRGQPNPDVAFCITDNEGKTNCTPEGRNITELSGIQCRNSLVCHSFVPVPDGEFNISILDIDISNHDTIGIGNCTLGQTCKLGQATITTSL